MNLENISWFCLFVAEIDEALRDTHFLDENIFHSNLNSFGEIQIDTPFDKVIVDKFNLIIFYGISNVGIGQSKIPIAVVGHCPYATMYCIYR